MANYIIDGTLLTNIAAAIRSKKGVSNTYTPAQMATAISGMSVGATQIVALDAYYSSTQMKIPASGYKDITLSASIDSIYRVRFTTYDNAPLDEIRLVDQNTIRVSATASTAAYLRTLVVVGYRHSIQ